MRRLRLELLVLFAGVLAGPAQAGGVFAREGIGEWLEGYDLRGETLGATGLGLIDPFSFCLANPASVAFAHSAHGYLGLVGSATRTKDGENESRHLAGTISGVGFGVPIGQGLALRFSLRPRTDGSYALRELVPTGSETPERNYRDLTGTRGFLAYQADVAWRAGRSWALGVSAGILTGSLLDEVEYTLPDSGWVDTEDRRTMRVPPTWTFGWGFQFTPHERIGIGGAMSGGGRLTLEETYYLEGGAEADRETTMDYPLGFGGGISVFLSERIRLTGDAYYRGWDNVEIGGAPMPQAGIDELHSTLRWGVGIERLPHYRASGNLLDRFAWRAGIAMVPWYYRDASGDDLIERRFTFGVGIPIRRTRGSVDLMCTYGQRGSLADNGVEEEYLRFGFGTAFARVLREY